MEKKKSSCLGRILVLLLIIGGIGACFDDSNVSQKEEQMKDEIIQGTDITVLLDEIEETYGLASVEGHKSPKCDCYSYENNNENYEYEITTTSDGEVMEAIMYAKKKADLLSFPKMMDGKYYSSSKMYDWCKEHHDKFKKDDEYQKTFGDAICSLRGPTETLGDKFPSIRIESTGYSEWLNGF